MQGQQRPVAELREDSRASPSSLPTKIEIRKRITGSPPGCAGDDSRVGEGVRGRVGCRRLAGLTARTNLKTLLANKL